MWMVIAREPRGDAPIWHGRKVCALVDALVWPLAFAIVALVLPLAGLAAPVIGGIALVIAVRRAARALFRNERYRFTTSRLVVPVFVLVSIGVLVRLLG